MDAPSATFFDQENRTILHSASNMDEDDGRENAVEEQQPREEVLERLLSQRNPKTKLEHATNVVRFFVRELQADPAVLAKLLTAVECGDSQMTDCVPFYKNLVSISRKKFPPHIFLVRAFRWAKINEQHVFSTAICTVDPGYTCINPYHYRRQPKLAKKGSICVVFGCKNYAMKSSPLSFFCLPDRQKRPDAYRIFFDAVARDDLRTSGFSRNHVICSDHFYDTDWETKHGKVFLKRTALPTRNLPRNVRLSREQRIHRKRCEFWTALRSATHKSIPDTPEWPRFEATPTHVSFGRLRIVSSDPFQTATDVIRITQQLGVELYVDGWKVPEDMYAVHPSETRVNLRRLSQLDFASFRPAPVPEVVPEIIPGPLQTEEPVPLSAVEQCRLIVDQCNATMTALHTELVECGAEDMAMLPTSAEAENLRRMLKVVEFTGELVTNASSSDTRRRYSASMLRFSSTVQGKSTYAYRFVREFLGNVLPNDATLRMYAIKEGAVHQPTDHEAARAVEDMQRDASAITESNLG